MNRSSTISDVFYFFNDTAISHIYTYLRSLSLHYSLPIYRQAVAGATSGQMVELQATILDIGSSSKFSTLEITEAAQQLAQAGFSTEEMEKALGAVTRLAAASGASIKERSDEQTSELQPLMRKSYAVSWFQKKKTSDT